jgi:hypothetical protein
MHIKRLAGVYTCPGKSTSNRVRSLLKGSACASWGFVCVFHLTAEGDPLPKTPAVADLPLAGAYQVEAWICSSHSSNPPKNTGNKNAGIP